MNTRARKREELSNTRVRTLVVDDSPFVLKILAELLEEAGKFELIGTASNGCQALRYVATLSPDLVLMDVHMPHLNGIEATRYIKQREHPPTVIITTLDDNAAAKAMAEEAGADGFISKDANFRQHMIDVLRKLFGPSVQSTFLGSAQSQDAWGVCPLDMGNCSAPNLHRPKPSPVAQLCASLTDSRREKCRHRSIRRTEKTNRSNEPGKGKL